MTAGEFAGHLDRLAWVLALGSAVAERERLGDEALGVGARLVIGPENLITVVANARAPSQPVEEVRYGSPIELIMPVVSSITVSVPALFALMYTIKRIYGFDLELRTHRATLERHLLDAQSKLRRAEGEVKVDMETRGGQDADATWVPDDDYTIARRSALSSPHASGGDPLLASADEVRLLEEELAARAPDKRWEGEVTLIADDD